MNRRLTRKQFLLAGLMVFLTAFGLRLGFLADRGARISSDSKEYIALAQSISQQGAFSLDSNAPLTPTVRRAPAYPAFLALFDLVHQFSPARIAFVQSLIDSAVAIMILALALLLVPFRWAAGAAIVYALHPGAIAITQNILTETLYTALLVGSVGLLVMGTRRDRLMLTALGGGLAGAAILCRTTAMLEPFALAVVLLATPRLTRRGLHILTLLLVTAIVVAPWSIRSSMISHKFVLVQAAGAQNLYAATRWDMDQKNEAELERVNAAEFQQFPETIELYKTERTQPERAAAGERIWVSHALQNIRAHPFEYFRSRLRTAPYLVISSFDDFTGVDGSFNSLVHQHRWFPLVIKSTLLLIFSLIPFLLGVLGLALVRQNLIAALCASVWLCTLVFHLPMWIEYRFWLPVVPLQMVNAVMAARWIWSRFQAKEFFRQKRQTGNVT